MTESHPSTCTAFAGAKRIASGDLRKVAVKAKAEWDHDKGAQVLIFDDLTSNLIEVDFRGTSQDVLRRITEEAANAARSSESATPEADPLRGPGRPKLGVVAREVTLLPRHWDWLAAQPGGASVALRKLVEAARGDPDLRTRFLRDSLYRFITATVGNAPGYEEAIRALYAGEREEFTAHIEAWPPD